MIIHKAGVVREAPSDDGDASIFAQSNVAVWVLTGAAGVFLAVRLYCRHLFSKLWWDDAMLAFSWLLLLVSAALLSSTIAAGYATDDAKRTFYLYQNTYTALTTVATAWSKVAFAVTLARIVRNQYLRYFLFFVIVSANLILVPGMLSIWIPACTDPRKVFRPEHTMCLDLDTLQYLGGATIVYGGVIDVLLALFPWFIIRKLLLETREKLGLTLAMSLGAITGTIVIFRAFFQLRRIDNNYHYMVFMSIFNFLEPCVAIIAQAIPMFRVLVVNVKKNSNAVRISSPSAAHISRSAAATHNRTWNSKAAARSQHLDPDDVDEELQLHVRVGSMSGGRHIVRVTAGPNRDDDSGSGSEGNFRFGFDDRK